MLTWPMILFCKWWIMHFFLFAIHHRRFNILVGSRHKLILRLRRLGLRVGTLLMHWVGFASHPKVFGHLGYKTLQRWWFATLEGDVERPSKKKRGLKVLMRFNLRFVMF